MPQMSQQTDGGNNYSDLFGKLQSVCQSTLNGNSEDVLYELAKLDLSITNSSILAYEQIRTGCNNCGVDQAQNLCRLHSQQQHNIIFDTFVLAVLQDWSKQYTIIIQLDESLLQNSTSFFKLTSYLIDDNQRLNFLTNLLTIKFNYSEDWMTDVLRCWKTYFGKDVGLNIHSNSKEILKKIGPLNGNVSSNVVQANIMQLNGMYTSVAERVRLYSCRQSYLSSIANDILVFKCLQKHFDDFAESDTEFTNHGASTPDSKISTIYEQLLCSASIEDLYEILYTHIPSIRNIYPFTNHLLQQMNERLNNAAYGQTLKLLKENVEVLVSQSLLASTARKLENINTSLQDYTDMEQISKKIKKEAEKFCSHQTSLMNNLKKELHVLESQGENFRMEQKKAEHGRAENNLIAARCYIEWGNFISKLSSLEFELRDQGFFTFDISKVSCQVSSLEQVIQWTEKWFKLPPGIINSNNFWIYVRKDRIVDKEDLLGVLKHLQTIHVIDQKNGEVEVLGSYLVLSDVLRRVQTSKFREIRIIARGYLTLDGLVCAPGKNILLYGDQITAPSVVVIDTAGQHGIPVNLSAKDGVDEGGRGGDGEKGQDGQSGGHVSLISSQKIQGLHNININTNGGSGAKGQDGGSGGPGRPGSDGKNKSVKHPGVFGVWSSYKFEADGEAGEVGWPGGQGGSPGDGGLPGSFGTIFIKEGEEEQTYNGMVCGNFSSINGVKGPRGIPGRCGKSGRGGRNGSGHCYATESFYPWDAWNEARGKFELKKVEGVFKGGYRIQLLQSEEDVRNTYAESQPTAQENIHLQISDPEAQDLTLPPNPEIKFDSPNLKRVLNISRVCVQSQGLLNEQDKKLDFSTASSYTSSGERRGGFKKILVQMETKEEQIKDTEKKISAFHTGISELESEIQEFSRRKSKRVMQKCKLEASMAYLKNVSHLFKEKNRLIAQTQVGAEFKICNIQQEYQLDFKREIQGNISLETQANDYIGNWVCATEFNGRYSNLFKDMLSKLENREIHIKDAFEKCLQTIVLHVTTSDKNVPTDFFTVIREITNKPDLMQKIRGYKFVEFISDILVSDIEVCLQNDSDPAFRTTLENVLTTCLCDEILYKLKSNFHIVYFLRRKSFTLQEMKKLENHLLTKDKDVPPSLKHILEDILERNLIEHFVEHASGSNEWKITTFLNGKVRITNSSMSDDYQRQILSERTLMNSIKERDGELLSFGAENVNRTFNENGDFTEFNQEQIRQAQLAATGEVGNKELHDNMIGEELRNFARNKLELYKEVKVLIAPKCSLAEFLSPDNFKLKNITEGSNIGNLIEECTKLNLDSMKSGLKRLCSMDTSKLAAIRNEMKLFPFYVYILSKLHLSLKELDELYALGTQLTKSYSDDKLNKELYMLFKTKYQDPILEKLKSLDDSNSCELEKLKVLVNSKHTCKTFEQRMACYESLLPTPSNEAIINLKDQVGLMYFPSCPKLNQLAQQYFNTNQTPITFLKLMQSLLLSVKFGTDRKVIAGIQETFPKICLHLEQFSFDRSQLNQLKEILVELEIFSEARHYVKIRSQLDSLIRVILTKELDTLLDKFDLPAGNGVIKCDEICNGILEMIRTIIFTSELVHKHTIQVQFSIILERIRYELTNVGKCSDFGKLSSKIGELKSKCHQPSEFLFQLYHELVDFLQRYECKYITLEENLHHVIIPLADINGYLKMVEKLMENVCEDQLSAEPLYVGKICEQINIFSSVFTSHHCCALMRKYLERSEEKPETHGVKYCIELKKTLDNKKRKCAKFPKSPITIAIQMFREFVNESLESDLNFSEYLHKQVFKARKSQMEAITFEVQEFQNVIKSLITFLDRLASININTESKFVFMLECVSKMQSAKYDAFMNRQLLNDMLLIFVNYALQSYVEFKPLQISTKNHSNKTDYVTCTLSSLFQNVFNYILHNSAFAETNQHKKERFHILQLVQDLFKTTVKFCWEQANTMESLYLSLEECHKKLKPLGSLKSNLVLSTNRFIEGILRNLLSTVPNNSFYEHLDLLVTNICQTTTQKYFLLLKCYLEINKRGKDDREITKLSEHGFWNLIYKSLPAQEIRNLIGEHCTETKALLSYAILSPTTRTEHERKFLLKILPQISLVDWKLTAEQLNLIRNHFTNTSAFNEIGLGIPEPFWIYILKPNVLEFLNIQERRIYNELSTNFLQTHQTLYQFKSNIQDRLANPSRSLDNNAWLHDLREELLSQIYVQYYSSGGIESEEDKHELYGLNFFMRIKSPSDGEARFISVMQKFCKTFQHFGNSISNEYKRSLLKYSQQISIEQLEVVMNSKLHFNWLPEILYVRLTTTIRDRLRQSRHDVEGLIVRVKETFSRSIPKEILNQFLVLLSDKLSQSVRSEDEDQSAQHMTSNLYEQIEDLCNCCSRQNLTLDLLQHLSTAPDLAMFKPIFRRCELANTGLTLMSIENILLIESNVAKPDVMNKFLKDFQKLFDFRQNERILNKILAKVEKQEWLINEERVVANFFNPEAYHTISDRETELEVMFEAAAIGMREKDLEGEPLVSKLCQDPTNKHLVTHLTSHLHYKLRKIRSNMTSSNNFENIIKKPLKDWSDRDIQRWTTKLNLILEHKNVDDRVKYLMEMDAIVLSIICRAIYNYQEYWPYDTQICSVLLFLNSDSTANFTSGRHGRLGQISTGEGKTLITAMLCTFWGLAKANVNVITSTHILAEDNLLEVQKLFTKFNISFSNNCDKKCKEGGDKEKRNRYLNQIIYGDLGSFQSDLLYTENFGKALLKDRTVHFVFVDEVDNMLLDKGGQMLYISHPIPEFRYLRPIFIKIWEIINKVHNEKNQYEKEDVIQRVLNDINTILEQQEIIVPLYLKKFVSDRLQVWVKNGLQALQLMENDPYIVSDADGGNVTILDQDTGVQCRNMQYSFGLHQFIELKHGDKLSCENLKAIFISNYSYFRRFSQNGCLYGISGTLGSNITRRILSTTYNVDCFNMERHKFRYCPSEEGVVARNEDEWLKAIKNNVQEKVIQQRAVLVIAKNVLDVQKITSTLAGLVKYDQLISYHSSNDERILKYIRENEIQPKSIIVGTNLAGRGTDFKISNEVVAGLHVILSYIPNNSRIEEQAFGRTGRQGQSGSTKFIVLCEALKSSPCSKALRLLRSAREENENERLYLMTSHQLVLIDIEEQLLEKFKAYNKKIQSNEEFKFLHKNIQELYLQLVRNRWAIWLDSKTEIIKLWKIYGKDRILNQFQSEFVQQTNHALENGQLPHFPSEFIKLAKAYEQINELPMSIKLLEKSAKEEPGWSQIALYYSAYCKLKLTPNELNERLKCIKDLKTARRLIQKTINEYQMLPSVLDQVNLGRCTTRVQESTNHSTSRNFSNQMSSYCALLTKHSNSIDAAIGVPLDDTLFRNVTGVSEMAEAKELFRETINSLRLKIKKFRVSKKLNNENIEVKLQTATPQMYNYCLEDMQIIITEGVKTRSRNVDFNPFLNILISRERFWELLEKEGAFENLKVVKRWCVTYSLGRYEAIEFPNELQQFRISIGLWLIKHNGKIYNKNFLLESIQTLEEVQLNQIEALLRVHAILTESNITVATLTNDFRKNIDFGANTIMNEKLKKYYWILQNCIQEKDFSVSENITYEKIPFLNHQNNLQIQADEIMGCLIAANIIKPCKIKLLSNTTDLSKLDEERIEFVKSIDDLEPKYTEIFNKFHVLQLQDDVKKTFKVVKGPNDQLKEDHKRQLKLYLKSVKSTILNSIGSLKMYGKVKPSVYSIEKNYTSSNCPTHVILEFIQSDFDRLLLFNQTIPWYRSGGTIVTLIGLAQIGLGIYLLFKVPSVGLALISEGLGDLHYGYKSGYTNPDFSTSEYVSQKVVSLIASSITCYSNFTGGLTVAAITKEFGEEFIKRKILNKLCTQAGHQIIGNVIHEASNWGRDYLLQRFKHWFMEALPVAPGYAAAMKNLQVTLHELFKNSYDTNQAKHILRDSFSYLWEDSNSVFMTSLKAALNLIAPQLITKISESISSTYGTIGAAIVESYETISKLLATQRLYKQFHEIIKPAEEALIKINQHLQDKIINLKIQKERREAMLFPTNNYTEFSSSTTIVGSNVYDPEFINDYIGIINQNLISQVFCMLQDKLIEPGMNDLASRALNFGLEQVFDEKRKNMLDIMEKNKLVHDPPLNTTSNYKLSEGATTSSYHLNLERHQGFYSSSFVSSSTSTTNVGFNMRFKNFNMDTILENADGRSIRQLY